jgi:co-chaperonin GroES (HSP10)
MIQDPTKWIPVNGQVIIKDDKKEEKVGSIYIPDSAEENRVIQGIVLSTAPFLLEDGRWMDPPCEKGDTVLYSNFAGSGMIIKIKDEVYRLAKWTDILAIVCTDVSSK